MQMIQLQPIGTVVSEVQNKREDAWGSVGAELRLDASRFELGALEGLADFSHVEVLFILDQINDAEIESRSRHPRENPAWPKVGIFAQRARKRPNRIGATICEIVGIDGLSLRVKGLDAFEGSPILDIKPVMTEFLPEKTAIREPLWASELMSTYF
jgi:tRNA-Thr(GGU) m(6)t(6)A37 methyltransferase TsaA